MLQAVKGDRVGICVAQLDSSLIERGLACAQGSVPTFSIAVASCDKIRFHTAQVRAVWPFTRTRGRDPHAAALVLACQPT